MFSLLAVLFKRVYDVAIEQFSSQFIFKQKRKLVTFLLDGG